MGGRYVPSLIAAIGEVIERHMARTGFIAPRTSGEEAEEIRLVAEANPDRTRSELSQVGRLCPRCSLPTLRHREGCLTCDSCGYSKCN
jgi:ribonucleoside-diphosphate reductase alpha chain